ncbi:hypothetical protein NQ317_019621 [Molorchus minor]|uniref:Snurportin-1 n=1 Tax=Molorchus minor TaxID=1323400 RepID=A0ABQ9JM62_9CUCU|nr:hypothetical protein NQ317_019621 [Molorchus minor]
MEEQENCHVQWLYCDLYKSHGKCLEFSQQQRREQFLEEQRQKRHEIADKNRNLCDTFLKEMDLEEMECDELQSSESSQGYHRNKKRKFRLMFSEFLTEVPEDLAENWFVKFCPQGTRVLLIAQKQVTLIFNANGQLIFKMKSDLPGGGRKMGTHYSGMTILDCVFHRQTKTIFIVDCLVWNSMLMLNSEAAFRFFWLKSQFADSPELFKCLKCNFILIETYNAQKPIIQDHMSDESHYRLGATPLVGWLSSFMLPEKLCIDVAPENLINKPKNYINLADYIEKLKSRKKKAKMDCNQPPTQPPNRKDFIRAGSAFAIDL